MNILFVGPDENNSTDGVIVQGIYNLLKKAFGLYDKDYIFINDHVLMNSEKFYTNNKYNLIVVCGTPWLWHNFHLSSKWKNLLNIIQSHPEAKVVFMGIGSCLTLDAPDFILESKEEVEVLQTYKNALVFVRDKLAQEKLQKANVAAFHLPCPSFYCYGFEPVNSIRERNILIWCNPEKIISSCDWQDKEKLKRYRSIIDRFIELYNPNIYCAKEEELGDLSNIKLLSTYIDTLELMKTANIVLSGRVHCAVPAFVQGAALGLIPFDTRSQTLENFGGHLINSIDEVENISYSENSTLRHVDTYITLLRAYIL